MTEKGPVADVEIRAGARSDIPSLRDLWLAVHQHHQHAMPALAPYVSDEQSWSVRQRLYEDLLSRPDSTLLLASTGGAIIGYALGYVLIPTERLWMDDTWSVDGAVGEVETLSVASAFRGRGVGRRLLSALVDALRTRGVENVVVGALPGNERAVALYRTAGFRPLWLHLGRLLDRSADAGAAAPAGRVTPPVGPPHPLAVIGRVESSIRSRDQAPRQPDEGAPPAEIRVAGEYEQALQGLAVADRIVVVTWLHEADRDVLRCHPRGDTTRPVEGVFATRSPDRPNPIGLHETRIVAIEGRVITVDRLEAIDGTPVLDIKPVLSA